MFFFAASTGSEDRGRRLTRGLGGWPVVSVVILAVLNATFVSGYNAAAMGGPGGRIETVSPTDAGGHADLGLSQVCVRDRVILVFSSETTEHAQKAR